MADEREAPQQAVAESEAQKLYTLTEVSEKTGISMPTLQRYKKNYQDRIPSVGEGRTQRYPKESFAVFKQLKKENIKRRGRPRKTDGPSRPPSKTKQREAEGLLTLTKVAEEAGISYPTAVRYVKLYEDRIPHEGTGRTRRYYPEAIEVFKQLRSESPRGRRPKRRSEGMVSRRGGGGVAVAGDGRLARRVEALERSHGDLEKQIKELIKQLKKPLKVTIER